MSTLTRAYSVLTVKSVNQEKRSFSGIATTPTPDRVGDIVEPLGAKFKNPLSLLLFHDHKRPVGTVKLSRATEDGIAFEATLPEISEEGELKKRVDEAWHSVKAGIVRGVSIGFRALEDGIEQLKSGGLRFTKTEILELSLVSVPANAEAVIEMIKSIDAPHLAASGTGEEGFSSTSSAGVTALPVVSTKRKDRHMAKTITDQIKDFEATRAAKAAERDGIMEKAGESGETLDAQQTEQYDGLTAELKSIDAHLLRLREREKDNIAQAAEVKGQSQAQASASRGEAVSVAVKDTMEPSIAFGAMVLCKAQSYIEMMKGNFVTPLDIAKARYPSNTTIHNYLIAKTAVAGGTTTDANFAASLLAPAQVLESAFLEYLRPKTIVDRFGTGNFPSLKRVPFNVKVQSQTSGASASWVGEGKGKPVTKFNTTDTTLLFTKIAAISVITEELARFSRPGAEGLVRDELAKAVIERMDTDFTDPAKAVSSGVNPASITNGLTALTSAGTSAANVLTDIQALVAPFLRLNYPVQSLVLLMPDTLALTLSLMQNSLGQDSFKGMTVNGGTLAGLPVMTSNYLASGASYGNMVICLSAENIALADDGKVSVDASREASIQMEDASTMDATAGTGQTSVSMFQTNSIAIRAEREINWKKLRSTAAVYMDDVNWGSIGSPV